MTKYTITQREIYEIIDCIEKLGDNKIDKYERSALIDRVLFTLKDVLGRIYVDHSFSAKYIKSLIGNK